MRAYKSRKSQKEGRASCEKDGHPVRKGEGRQIRVEDMNNGTAETIEELSADGREHEAADTEKEDAQEAFIDLEGEIKLIGAELPEICVQISDISDNKRYSELRGLGLTPREAYLAAVSRPTVIDNRAHLTGAVPKSASAPSSQMTRGELEMARSLFEDLNDNELRRLYKRVTK